MTQRNLSAPEVEGLYHQIVDLAKRHVGFHPALLVFDPSEAVSEWVRTHPEEARSLAQDAYRLLGRYFRTST
ncbi:MAG: hypothetical protein WC551_08195 [Patescibacteria group bacterium]